MGTAVVLIILIAVIAAITVYLIKNRGSADCNGDCASCRGCNAKHDKNKY